MNWDKSTFIYTISAFFMAAIGSAISSAYSWYNYKYFPYDTEREAKKARLKFLLSLSAFFVFSAITVILFFQANTSQKSSSVITDSINSYEHESNLEIATSINTQKHESNPEIADKLNSTIDPTTEEMGENISTQYDGATYYGAINKDTGLPNGYGKMEYDNQDVYEGNWINGVREGNGCMKYRNRDMYKGNWENNMRHGIGTYTWYDGSEYVGEYKNDMRDGEGTYIGWTGYLPTYGWIGTYRGTSKEDMFEGNGVFEFDNGDIFKGYFNQNRIWTGEYIRIDGSKYSIVEGEKTD